MIELLLGAIVAFFAITFGVIALWVIVRAPFLLVGAAIGNGALIRAPSTRSTT
jgi:hypothetical protein